MAIRLRKWATGQAYLVDVTVNGVRVREQFEKLRDAKAFEADTIARANAGSLSLQGKKVTLNQFWNEVHLPYLKERHRRGQRMTTGTLMLQSTLAELWVLATRPNKETGRMFDHGLGHLKLGDLTPDVVAKWLDDLFDVGLGETSVRHCRQALSAICDRAVVKRLLAANPVKQVRVIGDRNAKAKRRVTVPPKAVVRAMIERAPPGFRMRLIMSATTGLRPGELYALRWEHIDLDEGFVRVETRVDKYGEEDDQGPKTDAGNRTIPLAKKVLAELKAFRDQGHPPRSDQLVFSNRAGNYVNHDTSMAREFRPLKKAVFESSIVRNWVNFTYYDLRHFAISTWIEAGLEPLAIREFAGHKNIQFTYDTYGHLFPKKDHSDLMDKVAGDWLP